MWHQLLLPDVMVQSPAGDADATTEHETGDHRAIYEIVVIPVVDAGTDNHRALAFAFLGGQSPFARKSDDLPGLDTGELLLPGWCIRGPFVFIIFRVISA